uniref:Uncharacterized protein n=1 Tax=Salmonella sp. TaxID=599 RepID=A0A482ET88_SALSP|nr:hypothetical protein NNIBIDOC_00078 [Salmonella sp.]
MKLPFTAHADYPWRVTSSVRCVLLMLSGRAVSVGDSIDGIGGGNHRRRSLYLWAHTGTKTKSILNQHYIDTGAVLRKSDANAGEGGQLKSDQIIYALKITLEH